MSRRRPNAPWYLTTGIYTLDQVATNAASPSGVGSEKNEIGAVRAATRFAQHCSFTPAARAAIYDDSRTEG